jgi:carboxypeptidase PM20D1
MAGTAWRPFGGGGVRGVRLVIGLIALAVVGLAAVIVARAMAVSSRQLGPRRVTDISIDIGAAAERLGEAIRFRTISWPDPTYINPAAFLQFHEMLRDRYPAVHGALVREVVADYSLLYTWPGRDPSAGSIILLSHLDVVPVDRSTESRWAYPPFSGAVDAGAVWGRGALDDKVGVIGIMEAVDLLVRERFAPAPTVYLAFGHDEERGGAEGAGQIAKYLEQRGVRDAVLLDEGGFITTRAPGTTRPVALIGIAEKGYVSLELTVDTPGGHSSIPPAQTAVGILSRAIDRLQSTPMPARLEGPTRALLEALAPEVSFGYRLLFANLWAFSPVVVRTLSGTPITNALVRTTTAATMIAGGTKDNVLPTAARGVVNFRILPGDTVAAVVAHAARLIDDRRVQVRIIRQAGVSEPSPVAALDERFDQFQQAVRDAFPGVAVAPFLTLGATDARHYRHIAPNAYRLLPVNQPDVERIVHGIDERINVDQLANTIRFYVTLLRHLGS